MAPELSSNWKSLQAKIKAESGASTKRKAGEEDSAAREAREARAKKKQKVPAKLVAASSATGRGSAGSSIINPRRKRPIRPDRSLIAPPGKAAGGGMGVTQSSKITQDEPSTSVSPSLALWASENDISPEAVAEAYGLGIKGNSLLNSSASKPNAGLTVDSVDSVGKYIALDCEMVGVGPGGYESVLARVSVVDFHGKQVYDSYVKPKERVTDWRTSTSGVAPKHMFAAREMDDVQAQIAELLQGRVLVGHDLQHDLSALQLKQPPSAIRDTAKFSGFKKYGHGPKPALRVVAREVLGVEIQSGQHSSLEDARATMLLFRKHKQQFDAEHLARYPDRKPEPAKSKHSKKTKKKRRN